MKEILTLMMMYDPNCETIEGTNISEAGHEIIIQNKF